jgi:F-box and WD-40 domain protein CDC4
VLIRIQLNEQQDALKSSNGVLTSVRAYDGLVQNASPLASTPHASSVSASKRRAVSPSSKPQASRRIRSLMVPSDARGTASQQRKSRLGGVAPATNSSVAGLATPETELSRFRLDQHATLRKRIHSERVGQRASVATSSQGDTDVSQASTPRQLSPTKPSVRRQYSTDRVPALERRASSMKPVSTDYQDSQSAPEDDASAETVATENEASQESEPYQPSGPTSLSVYDGVLGQDMCLPSPSLSPVTAMNTHNPDYFLEFPEDQGTDTDSSLDNQAPVLPASLRQKNIRNISSQTSFTTENAVQSRPTSLMDIPATLEFFEAIPDEMKTYMMYQLLKRCPKPTLQFVADVVNPALKCDFLALLPAELTLSIVRYFDYKTMCRASQVSKKWRHIVNSDERAWKELFDRDGFKLPPGELQQAIREGWGWQFPNGRDDWEKDLSTRTASTLKSDSDTFGQALPFPLPSNFVPDSLTLDSVSPRRSKRKAANRTPSRKVARRKLTSSHMNESPASSPSDWLNEASLLGGPGAAANAAAAAIPYPDVGLPSLRSLHVYKSLYQRHFSIKNSWMRPNLEPKHLAFRAHDRHVVTCLQFDSDKILTGSDDTKIHVYETKTGALKSILSGHEGGVWALEYYGNTLVSGSTDRSVRVWDIEKAKCTQIFHGHTSTVRCLQILLPTEVGKNPDGSSNMMPKEPLIITGSRDSNLRVWKLPKPNDPYYLDADSHADDTDCPYFLRVLTGHQYSVRAIAAHGDTLVSGSYDCTVRVWKISTGESLHKLQGHTLKVYSVVLDVERNRCISGSMDHMVKVWSLDTGALLYNLEGHSSLVGLLDLKSNRLVSGAADSTLRIWNPESGQCKNILTAHTGAITCFQHDGEKIISGSDRTLKMWNVRTGECVKDLLRDLSGVWQVRFDGRTCVAAVQRDGLTYIEVSRISHF